MHRFHGIEIMQILIRQQIHIQLEQIQLIVLDQMQHQVKWPLKLIDCHRKRHRNHLAFFYYSKKPHENVEKFSHMLYF